MQTKMLVPGPTPTHEVVRMPEALVIARSADPVKLTELAAWLTATRMVGDEGATFIVRPKKRQR